MNYFKFNNPFNSMYEVEKLRIEFADNSYKELSALELSPYYSPLIAITGFDYRAEKRPKFYIYNDTILIYSWGGAKIRAIVISGFRSNTPIMQNLKQNDKQESFDNFEDEIELKMAFEQEVLFNELW